MTHSLPHSSTACTDHQVLMVAYAQCMSLDITGPLQVFATANDVRALHGQAPFYDLHLVAAQAGPVRLSCGLDVLAPLAWSDAKLHARTTVLVPGGDGVELAQHDVPLRAWLQQAEPQVM
ncbi:MAG: hypothetical protein KBT18_00890, partial [Comamonas sp.]|nr:hypothetical protein [Candidatus Comamonas equi]